MPDTPATEFKAECLELMDRVAEGHETYIMTRCGRQVAKPAVRIRGKAPHATKVTEPSPTDFGAYRVQRPGHIRAGNGCQNWR